MVDKTQAFAFHEGEYRQFLPHLSIDCVIFGFHSGELKVLLLKWKHLDAWSLPGGYIRREESIADAARRVLRDRTGLDNIYLQQFHTFGGVNRGERMMQELFSRLALPVPEDPWFLERVVSIGFYALVDFSRTTPMPDFFSEACRWWDIRELPQLILDHNEIARRALRALRAELAYRPAGRNLLPEKFTMPELQKLYETLLGRPLDRRNFQRKILSLGIVERLEKRSTGGAHRSPYLYRFNAGKYNEALGEDGSFGF